MAQETYIEIAPTFGGVLVKTTTLTADDCGGKEISTNFFNMAGAKTTPGPRTIVSSEG